MQVKSVRAAGRRRLQGAGGASVAGGACTAVTGASVAGGGCASRRVEARRGAEASRRDNRTQPQPDALLPLWTVPPLFLVCLLNS
jgi:hypothetical protein